MYMYIYFFPTGEKTWNQVVRRLKKGSSFMHKHNNRTESHSKKQLFGQPLSKISPDHCSLPKPITVSHLSTANVIWHDCQPTPSLFC